MPSIFIHAYPRVLLTFGFTDSSLGSTKLKWTEGAIEQYRDQIDARTAENYGFASQEKNIPKHRYRAGPQSQRYCPLRSIIFSRDGS